jgi:hypothetical protein
MSLAIEICDAFQGNMAALWVKQANQEPQYGAFARTALAEQNGCFTCFG